MRQGSTRWIVPFCSPSSKNSLAGRSASKLSPRPSAKKKARSRTCTNLICSRKAISNAPPGDGWRHCARIGTSVSPGPEGETRASCCEARVTMTELGKALILFGGFILLIGVLLTLGGKIPWLGRLPGDILIQRPHFTFYFPLATSLLVSVLLSLLFFLWRR